MRALLIWVAALVAPSLAGAQIETFRQLDFEVATLRAAGKTSQALEAAQRLVEFTERSYPPTDTTLALSLERLALVYEDAGQVDEADALLRRAIAIRKRDPYASPNLLAFDLAVLGGLEQRQGRGLQAEHTYEEALVLLKDFQDASKSITMRINYQLGTLYALGRRPERAEPLLRAAYDSLVADGMEVSAESALIFRWLANAKQTQGDYQEAAKLYESAVEVAVRSKGEDAPFTANIRHDMATNWVMAGMPARGAQIQERAVAVLDASPATTPQNLAIALSTMAQIKLATGDLDGAYLNARRAFDLRVKVLGESNRLSAGSAKLLAEIEMKRGRASESAKFAMKAKAIQEGADARDKQIPIQQVSLAETLRPVYPPEARRFGQQGKTVVRASVGADGIVTSAKLASSSGYRSLDDAAIKAVLGGKFHPATNSSGQPVGGGLVIPINWVLSPSDRVEQLPLTYGDRVAATVRRELVYADADAIQGNPATVVMVQMKGDGMIAGRALQESSGVPAWDAAVLAAIDKTGKLPVDADGFAPSQLVLHVRPKR